MKKIILSLVFFSLVACTQHRTIQVEYGSDTEYPVDTFKLGKYEIDENTTVEVIDTQMPVFTESVDIIEDFNEETDLNDYFKAEDPVDGELEVHLKNITEKEIEVIVIDENENMTERKARILLEDSIDVKEIKSRFDDKIIELPKPVEPEK